MIGVDDAQLRLISSYSEGKKDIGIETRKKKTIDLLIRAEVNSKSRIYDMGLPNMMADHIIGKFGCHVHHSTKGDLNIHVKPDMWSYYNATLVTSFEVFEHLYNLFPVLRWARDLGVPLVGSVPLRFPFSKQYWTDDYYDRHYNEFEVPQFRWIMDEAGWDIVYEEFWYLDFNLKGIRPFLRTFLAPSWLGFIARPKPIT